MPDLNLTRSARPPALVRQGGLSGQNRTLLNANREAMDLLGISTGPTDDPKGRVLREWRLQLGMDPSLLATQACMSLSQLYELENGGHSRFYSASLRRQAARRVAKLLGLDWDQIEAGVHTEQPGSSNVVTLQRPPMAKEAPSVAAMAAAAMTPAFDGVHAPVAVPAVALDSDVQAIPMGLAAPASETLLVEPQGGMFTTEAKTPTVPKSSGWSTLLALLLVVVAGAAAGYGFAEYSPYRLYWPW